MASGQLDNLIKSLSDRLNEFERAGTFNPLTRGTCARCSHAVIGKLTEALNKNWHPECFLCDSCRNVLDGNFFIENDKPFCDVCYGNSAVKCSGCNGPITEGSYISAGGKNYHPQHFACGKCRTIISNGVFAEEAGIPYCQNCAR